MNLKLSSILLLISFSSLADNNGFIVGVGIHPTSYQIPANNLVSLLSKYDIKSIRFDYPWSHVEKKKGIYTSPDNILNELPVLASNNDISTLLILDYGNDFYGGWKPSSPEQIDAFSNYASWVAQHYKGRKVIYEIWNEWSHDSKKNNYDPKSDRSAIEYVSLVKSVSQAIKNIDKTATVIAGGFNPINGPDRRWGVKIINLGVYKYVDGISIHPYSYQRMDTVSPNYNISILKNFEREINENKKNQIKLYITEFGYPNYSNGIGLNSKDREKYPAEYISEVKKLGFVKGIWWYDFINDGNDANNRQHNFGLLDSSHRQKFEMKGFQQAISENSQ